MKIINLYLLNVTNHEKMFLIFQILSSLIELPHIETTGIRKPILTYYPTKVKS